VGALTKGEKEAWRNQTSKAGGRGVISGRLSGSEKERRDNGGKKKRGLQADEILCGKGTTVVPKAKTANARRGSAGRRDHANPENWWQKGEQTPRKQLPGLNAVHCKHRRSLS